MPRPYSPLQAHERGLTLIRLNASMAGCVAIPGPCLRAAIIASRPSCSTGVGISSGAVAHLLAVATAIAGRGITNAGASHAFLAGSALSSARSAVVDIDGCVRVATDALLGAASREAAEHPTRIACSVAYAVRAGTSLDVVVRADNVAATTVVGIDIRMGIATNCPLGATRCELAEGIP